LGEPFDSHRVAQIFDAGTAAAGYGPQPYFAMELIRGQTLGDYASGHGNTGNS
jgi:hypothetical protein